MAGELLEFVGESREAFVTHGVRYRFDLVVCVTEQLRGVLNPDPRYMLGGRSTDALLTQAAKLFDPYGVFTIVGVVKAERGKEVYSER